MRRAALLLLAVFLAGTALGADGEESPPGGSHAGLACDKCHRVKGAAPEDCDACHFPERSNPHPVGVTASMEVPPDLPLGEGRRVMCRTCHVMHGGAPGRKYVRDGTECYANRRTFCYRCHKEGMGGINPHLAKRGSSRCLFCHVANPEGAPKPAETVRQPSDKPCRFCHTDTERGHAFMATPIPGGSECESCCVDCHDPHGTAQTTHYLKQEVAEKLVRTQEKNPHTADFESCRACHTTSFAKEITPGDLKLLYGGSPGMLCLSCHAAVRDHHPTGMGLTADQKRRVANASFRLPLDERGNVTCVTCHLSACAKGTHKMEMRYYDRETMKNDLCWICHELEEFSEHDPHLGEPESCRWCHESRPSPGLKGEAGLLASPTMVCLQCHLVSPHPGNRNHAGLIALNRTVPKDLPLGKNGEITCSTCHDPHRDGDLPRERLRSRSRNLCTDCHRR